MCWHLLQDKEKIIRIIEYLIYEQIEIKVRIEGEETKYSSRFFEIVPGSNRGDVSVSSDEVLELVMDKLAPERGNVLIQQFPKVGIELLANDYLCRCQTKYICATNTYPYHSLIMSFPELLELEEKRREERATLEPPEVISAVFDLVKGPGKDQSYELNVINYSDHGLALLVTEKDLNLLQMLNPGDRIPEMVIFAEPGLIHIDGIVRHKTRVEAGRYRDNYILGLESNTKIKAIINEVPNPSGA